MITIKHNSTTYTVTEANAPKIRAILDSGKLPRPKIKIDRQHDATRRDYPAFYPGMTTAEYVALFQGLNSRSRLKLTTHEFTHADRAAPMLDATYPEVTQELDPDYVESVRTEKRKTPTVAQLRKACQDALDSLLNGDIDTAQCILNEVIE
jgi:hypothetical protein